MHKPYYIKIQISNHVNLFYKIWIINTCFYKSSIHKLMIYCKKTRKTNPKSFFCKNADFHIHWTFCRHHSLHSLKINVVWHFISFLRALWQHGYSDITDFIFFKSFRRRNINTIYIWYTRGNMYYYYLKEVYDPLGKWILYRRE